MAKLLLLLEWPRLPPIRLRKFGGLCKTPISPPRFSDVSDVATVMTRVRLPKSQGFQ